MKVELELRHSGAAVLRDAGHDVATVVEQAMTSAADITVIEACGREGRCLVTLGLDFV